MSKLDWWIINLPFNFHCRRDVLSWEDVLNLASFLGEQLRNLHILPHPSFSNSTVLDVEKKREFSFAKGMDMEFVSNELDIPAEWEIFARTLSRKKKDVSSRLNKWYSIYLRSEVCWSTFTTNSDFTENMFDRDIPYFYLLVLQPMILCLFHCVHTPYLFCHFENIACSRLLESNTHHADIDLFFYLAMQPKNCFLHG